MNDLQAQFVIEARELVRQATDDLIALERDGTSPERIDRVLRAFHTLKGSAGVVELPAMTILLHAAEDLLATVKQGTVEVSTDIIDQSLACVDQVSRWVDDYEATGALLAQAGEDGRLLAERLRALLPGNAPTAAKAPAQQAAPQTGGGAATDPILRLVASASDRIASYASENTAPLFAVTYEPIAGCFFNGDDPLQSIRQLPGLLALHIEPRKAFPPLAGLDPYACNLRLLAIVAGERDALAERFRLVPDQVRISAVPVDTVPAAKPGANDGREKMALVRAVLDAQCELLRVPNRQDDLTGCIGAACRVAANALRSGGYSQLAETVEGGGALALSRRNPEPLLAVIERAASTLDRDASSAPPDAMTAANALAADTTEPQTARALRVSENKIEALVNLASELIVAKNALAHSTKLAGQALGGQKVAAAIRRDHDAIDRLALELHSTILQLRMISVAQVFRSFPRLVRDVARQLNKNVDFVTRGDTTEADKTIVDRLFEPLVHLLRNAVDHGVESSEQRRAAGKSEIATISIQASRAGDRFLVEVSDDGQGIDPTLVRRKAAERRLLPAAELDALTDEQAIELIFAPGFSTAAAVSDVSGRGIGMDVVRTAVEQIGGRVSLASKAGAGTTVRLDLPMTIAMTRVMVVEAGGQAFGISMDAVSETVRITPDRISRIKNNDGFVLRDRIVPIISLAEVMKLPDQVRKETAARLFVVIEAGGGIAAFEIDSIRDRLEVVLKPMQGLLAGARGYAGTTLLGNGQVLLVLDAKEIMP